MAHTAGEAPFSALCKYLRTAPSLRGIAVLAGARRLADEGAPPRVVLFPTSGKIEASSDDGAAMTDVMLDVDCHCWGQDHDRLWDVVRRLLDATRRYRLAGNEVRWGDVVFDEEPDTARDGESAVVTLTLRAGLDEVELSSDGGEGDVDALRYQPAPGSDGPTINKP